MKHLFANNATSALAIDTAAGSSTLTVMEGHGASFPQPTGDGSDGFTVTVEDRRTQQLEICLCTMRTGDILNVLRGQENTLALDFHFGANVSHRPTAKTMYDVQELAITTEAYTKPEADQRFVIKTGDLMSGGLGVPPPTNGLHATNKDYVDNLTGSMVAAIEGKEPRIIGGLPTQYWAGDKTWKNFAAGGGGGGGGGPATGLVSVGDAEPVPSVDNQLWWQSSTGRLAIRYDSTWVQVNISPGGEAPPPPGPVLGLVDMLPAAPTAPIEGQQWWETDTGHMFIRFGGAWVQTNTSIASVTEAPLDGQRYERMSGAWVVAGATGGTGGIPEAPTNGQNFLRRGSDGSWVAGLPLTGGDLTGSLTTSGNVTANSYRCRAGSGGALGGNWFNFNWDPNGRIQAWIDVTFVGHLAFTSDFAGYLPKSGGVLTGQLNVNTTIVANYVQANTFGASRTAGPGDYVITGNCTAGGGGGVIGWSGSYYGITGYNNLYSLYGNGSIYVSGSFSNGSHILSTGGYIGGALSGSDVLTTSANCQIGTNGTVRRTTGSSLRIKKDVENLIDDVAYKILRLRPIFHRYRIRLSEHQDWSHYSLGAEEAAAVDPRFASYDKTMLYDDMGRPIPNYVTEIRPLPNDPTQVRPQTVQKGWKIADEETPDYINWPAVTTALLRLVQLQDERISALEAARG